MATGTKSKATKKKAANKTDETQPIIDEGTQSSETNTCASEKGATEDTNGEPKKVKVDRGAIAARIETLKTSLDTRLEMGEAKIKAAKSVINDRIARELKEEKAELDAAWKIEKKSIRSGVKNAVKKWEGVLEAQIAEEVATAKAEAEEKIRLKYAKDDEEATDGEK